MWFDSHCHLDAHELSHDLPSVLAQCAELGVKGILIPAVEVASFDRIIGLVEQWQSVIPGICFTLGIHPLYTKQAPESDVEVLKDYLLKYHDHPRLVGVGEIGLDYFVEFLDNPKQEWFFEEQLKIAQQYQLPVILHVRKSQDQLLKRLRKISVVGGIAHAFNGSHVQTQHFLDLNFKLGFGGTMTYARALQIHRLVKDFPLSSYVIETDAPDIPPAWLIKEKTSPLSHLKPRNSPSQLPQIAQSFASLRGLSIDHVAQMNLTNLRAVIPRLDALLIPLVH